MKLRRLVSVQDVGQVGERLVLVGVVVDRRRGWTVGILDAEVVVVVAAVDEVVQFPAACRRIQSSGGSCR